jgi:CHASE2 domain-containing sensor protein
MRPLASRIPRKPGVGAAGACLSVLLGLCCLTPLGSGLVNLSYDLAFLFRASVPVTDAVVVYMDLDSHTRLGQGTGLWDRKLHAKLIDRLTALHAKTVVFDVVFAPFTNEPAADAELVRAAKRNGRVVVGATAEPDYFEGELINWQLKTPFPELEAAAGWGMVVAASADGYVRKEHHRKDFNVPSMAWQAARLSASNPPPDAFLERWINYYGPPGMLPHLKYWEVLELTNQITANDFSNRVVFVGSLVHVGMAGDQKRDFFPIPYSRWKGTKSPGVEINATTFLNLIRGDWLERSSYLTELALVILGGGVFGFLLANSKPMQAAGLGMAGALAIGIVANLLVWKTRVWFPWLIVSGVQIPGAAAWSILAHNRRLSREKRALEQALAIAAAREQVIAAQTTPAPPQNLGATVTAAVPAPLEAGAGTERAGLSIPDYALVRKIGEGAYGEVWLARNIIGSYHAAKFVHRRHFAEAAPFEREFNGIRRFTPLSRGHAGLVQVLHIGRNNDPECIYYVMELADDEVTGQNIDPMAYAPRDLAKELKKRQTLPLPEIIRIGRQLAEALAYLHLHDTIHRDIKPSNIIFVRGVAKLADIGLVTEVAGEGRDVSYLGTEGYIPPEGPGTPAADVYSLGKVIYQAATGFHIRRFPELPSGIMEGTIDDGFMTLNRIIMKACEVDPKERYPSAAELGLALAGLDKSLGERRGAHPPNPSPS